MTFAARAARTPFRAFAVVLRAAERGPESRSPRTRHCLFRTASRSSRTGDTTSFPMHDVAMAAWGIGYWLCVCGGVALTALVTGVALSGRDDLRVYPLAVGLWILLLGSFAMSFMTGLLKGIRVTSPGPGWFLSPPMIVGVVVAFVGGHVVVAVGAAHESRRHPPQERKDVVHMGGLTELQLTTAERYQEELAAQRRRQKGRKARWREYD